MNSVKSPHKDAVLVITAVVFVLATCMTMLLIIAEDRILVKRFLRFRECLTLFLTPIKDQERNETEESHTAEVEPEFDWKRTLRDIVI